MWKANANAGEKTALVFGRESQGLSREETLVLSHLLRIPMPSELLSLNISHAVAIGLYAFLGSDAIPASISEEQSGRPIQSENAAVLSKLLEALEQKGFFRGGKEIAQRESTRILWQRLQPTQQELDFLAGMLKRLSVNS